MIKKIILGVGTTLLTGCIGFSQDYPIQSNSQLTAYPTYKNSNKCARFNTFSNGQPTIVLKCSGDVILGESNKANNYSPYECTASTIPTATILNALNSGNVRVQTIATRTCGIGNITVNSPITLPNGAPGDLIIETAGNITLNTSVILGNANSQNTNLTLIAANGTISDTTSIEVGAYNITMISNKINFTRGSTINAFGELHNGGGTLRIDSNNLVLQSTTLYTQSAATIGTIHLKTKGIITLDGTSICAGNYCNLILEDRTGIKRSYIGS